MIFLKKYVGLKISLFLTVSLLFVLSVFLIVVSQFSSSFLEGRNFITLVTFFSLAFIFVQILLVVLAVGLFINRPLREVILSMKRVSEGYLQEKCELDSGDEFGELSQNFNKMIVNINGINENRQLIEKKLVAAEQGLKYKKALEEKATIIEKMNQELASAFSDVSLLYTVSQQLSSILEIDELIKRIDTIFADKFSCDAFALYFISPDQNKAYLAAYKGDKPKLHIEVFSNVQANAGLMNRIVLKQKSLYINDVSTCDDEDVFRIQLMREGSAYFVPLLIRETVIGLLSVSRNQNNRFSPTDRQSLESIASQIAVTYDRSRLYTKTKELSVRDELTTVYNRRYFHQQLHREFERAKRFQRPLSLLMIDIDHYKLYNDTYGHIKGDEVLRKFAQLMQKNIREIDVLARFGGEEFVVLLSDTRLKDAVTVAQKLRQLIKTESWSKLVYKDTVEDQKPQTISISIGVATYPVCALTQDELIARADHALYQAKQTGRDRVCVYEDQQQKQVVVNKTEAI